MIVKKKGHLCPILRAVCQGSENTRREKSDHRAVKHMHEHRTQKHHFYRYLFTSPHAQSPSVRRLTSSSACSTPDLSDGVAILVAAIRGIDMRKAQTQPPPHGRHQHLPVAADPRAGAGGFVNMLNRSRDTAPCVVCG